MTPEQRQQSAEQGAQPEACECAIRKALEKLVRSCSTIHPDWGADICAPDGNDMSAAIAALASPCSCTALREENERLKAGLRSQAIAGTRCWFYAPCAKCGAIEGMGLTMKGAGTVVVWCCYCDHFGPVIQGRGEDADRSAVMAWNQEFAKAFAERDSLRAELETLRQPRYAYHSDAAWARRCDNLTTELAKRDAEIAELAAASANAATVEERAVLDAVIAACGPRGCGCVTDMPGDNSTCAAHQVLFRYAARHAASSGRHEAQKQWAASAEIVKRAEDAEESR